MTSRQVQEALKHFGFRRSSRGRGGHEVWIDDAGRRVSPSFRKKEMHEGSLFSTLEALEGLGVCTRSEFRRVVKGYDKGKEAA
jgi:hypothetical protein